jgi:hypothetical protein
MSATSILEPSGLPEAPKNCQILILCEDLAACEHAMEVCRRMMVRFAGELDFDLKCWNFTELVDTDCARSATKIAGTADIILLALHGVFLPPTLETWLTAFPETRFRANGALALVWDGTGRSAAVTGKLFTRLEQLAGWVGMDFVPLVSGPVKSNNPAFHDEDWLPAVTQDENLHRPPLDHWGLNE